ncbi:GNAT family N-acetyltransferase [Actinoplanes sp. TBRC 11911]|uniref:GNAT family N-acetyltransferase n=1 Tax=Actinoplanes sp. TBRC 11911 TaxID=2729386 RepID=UPI00145CC7CD|nr:GNAT family N-acetyltransferase [Actinoplanes sp. TBRC 11911]NMO56122.1 GNAT family N-acetyltransferase [Actinoplanes sp. TBRC 11911]
MEPPEVINGDGLVLRRWEPVWAAEAAAAVRESLPELMQYMPWASEAYDEEASRAFLETSSKNWAEGTEFNYGIFDDDGQLVGSVGLMTRMGPGIMEVGYWMRSAYAGRGYMTAAVREITRVALTLPEIERVAIRFDASNAGSAAVARKNGFAEVRRIEREPQAPGETGTDIVTELRKPAT